MPSREHTPHFIFINPKPSEYEDPSTSLCDAWNRAIAQYFPSDPSPPFTVYEGKLNELDADLLRCDCIVSPANSYGIMDGGYDLFLSQSFQGTGNKWKLTDHVQNVLHEQWLGYAPPGSCTLVPLADDMAGTNNPWGARIMAVIPTMRVPDDISWHQDLVYNCIWSLLCEIVKWNRNPNQEPIRTVLSTGLGTGTGEVDHDQCARQMVLAVKHFQKPLPVHPRWAHVESHAWDVEESVDSKERETEQWEEPEHGWMIEVPVNKEKGRKNP